MRPYIVIEDRDTVRAEIDLIVAYLRQESNADEVRDLHSAAFDGDSRAWAVRYALEEMADRAREWLEPTDLDPLDWEEPKEESDEPPPRRPGVGSGPRGKPAKKSRRQS